MFEIADNLLILLGVLAVFLVVLYVYRQRNDNKLFEKNQVCNLGQLGQEELSLILTSAGEGIYGLDSDGNTTFVNPAALNMLGYKMNEVVGKPMHALVHHSYPDGRHYPREKCPMYAAFTDGEIHQNYDEVLWRKDGSSFPVEYTSTPVRKNGKLCGAVVVFKDISEHKKQEAALKKMALTDYLTKVHNRRYLENYVSTLIEDESCEAFSMFYIDLDGFKQVNDTLGHTEGDLLLVKVTERIQSLLAEGDVLTRVAGDEFIIVCKRLHEPEGVHAFALQLIEMNNEPYFIDGRNLTVKSSIGVVSYPSAGKTTSMLLRAADMTLCRAKNMGKDQYQVFKKQVLEEYEYKVEIEKQLESALENNEFALHLQPQINLLTNKIQGAEALLRWNNPVLGNVPPDRFIGILEQNGRISDVGLWVIEEALSQFSQYQALVSTDFILSINISPHQCSSKNIVNQISKLILKYDIPVHSVEFELTETGMLANEQTLQVLNELHSLGMKIAIDDFGTGYSSLTRLKEFPIDILKIDRTFVLNIEEDGDSRFIVESTVDLAKKLNLIIIGEGVETKEQMEFLRKIGCDIGQGYLFSKPLPFNDFIAYLKANKS